MMRLAILRHAPTEWNAQSRIQGHTDIPLSAAGRAAIARHRLPADLAEIPWFASPLMRAQETARLLGLRPVTDPRLIEMSSGDWEGSRLVDLRAADPEGMDRQESLGILMRPPGGETPSEVMARLSAFGAEKAGDGLAAIGAIAHKGVLRAALALATGWDMREKAPVRLDWAALHIFDVDHAGRFAIADINLPLADKEEFAR